MKTATIRLKSVSPYSPSRQHEEPKLEKESPQAYEDRTWRHKAWTNGDGEVLIPGLQLKKCIEATVKHFGETIPGKGRKTWAKHFESGLLPLSDLHLGVKIKDVRPVVVGCNPRGIRGGGGRVPRTFPEVPTWESEMQMAVLDDTITKEIFERYLAESGRYNGLGRWRPANGGMNGRFEVVSVSWE